MFNILKLWITNNQIVVCFSTSITKYNKFVTN